MSIKVGKFTISQSHEPFVIAEMSGNHNNDLDRALKIVEAAAKAGAHALKIQTYTADTMTLNLKSGDFVIHDPSSPWAGQSLYELYEKASTPYEWHEKIFQRCNELGIIGFSTPFDPTAVEFLESLNVPLYKVSSLELVDIPLIERIAKTKKPLILSTGMGSVQEISDAVTAFRNAGGKDLVLLKCTSAYPADPHNYHLKTLPHMRELFQCEVGVSDHTLGLAVPIASVAFGATVIEKHFTLRRADGGVDSSFSSEPEEMAALVKETKLAREAVGSVMYQTSAAEGTAFSHRRSLYITKNIKAGEKLTPQNVRAIRPGGGLPPKYLSTILGMKAGQNLEAGTPLKWSHFSSEI